ncbi:hypothetical protein B0T25DRAFT_557982 [Lasiosphaeria hispida]|uniref:Uncharacterized protein n=1 Tax=Lasiosphaeria hispida TaxID=260671 RepID=A0AAJ0H665_9PEZI|nr:hypothetical protein B0T25DRAFT_557982 [Lasiosphaeria hispida]
MGSRILFQVSSRRGVVVGLGYAAACRVTSVVSLRSSGGGMKQAAVLPASAGRVTVRNRRSPQRPFRLASTFSARPHEEMEVMINPSIRHVSLASARSHARFLLQATRRPTWSYLIRAESAPSYTTPFTRLSVRHVSWTHGDWIIEPYRREPRNQELWRGKE